jgi:hypothetical protein
MKHRLNPAIIPLLNAAVRVPEGDLPNALDFFEEVVRSQHYSVLPAKWSTKKPMAYHADHLFRAVPGKTTEECVYLLGLLRALVVERQDDLGEVFEPTTLGKVLNAALAKAQKATPKKGTEKPRK